MNTPLRGWRLQDECAMPPLEVTKNTQDKTKWGRHKALQFYLKLSRASLIQNSNLPFTKASTFIYSLRGAEMKS